MDKLTPETKKILGKIAKTIRGIAMDATQKADSGHPGLPMGLAELGAYLFSCALRYNPKNPQWINRDRLVLSAGHGSLWLYTLLHLSGYPLSMDELKHFRQFQSKTPGHPEYGMTPGVEATTGPLGQGSGNAVGMALANKILAEKFNTRDFPLFTSKVYCVVSDGDIMEGVCSEASSLAGHLQLNNLIFLYDSNQVSLDGPLSESCSENTVARYQAYGWETYEVDGYDLDQIHEILNPLKTKQEKPVFIKVRTIIGKGAPTKAGTYKAHGSPLGAEEVKKTKEILELPEEEFFIPQAVRAFFEEKLNDSKTVEEKWQELFRKWSKLDVAGYKEFKAMQDHLLPENLEEKLWGIEVKPVIATRDASQQMLPMLAKELPFLYGGSADLSNSDKTLIKDTEIISPSHFAGRNIKFGVREFGMATIANGLFLSGMILPFIGTFLTFSDYMRNAIRLAALSHYQVIYQFTHDSIFLGEDGPTHQPIEHYASLRTIPHLQVIRPADANETRMAWLAALTYKGPTALLLSRQPLKELAETRLPYKDGMGRGAYILKKETKTPDYTLFATGSEVALALSVAKELEKRGKAVRVVSMPCWQIFEKQETDYKKSVVGGELGKRVSIEAGVELGWHKYIGTDGITIGMDSFGASAPYDVLASAFGFEVDPILERILT